MAPALSERLTGCASLDEFYGVCAPLGLYGSGRRFMHIELDITNRCNIRCVMCYHSFAATRRAVTVHVQPMDFAQRLAGVLPYAYRLSLSLGNEPLMSPHFSDILGIVATHAVPHVNFFTNGLLLNDANIDAIIDGGVTQVCISIDGATRATYNQIRRDGDFDQLTCNLQRLIDRRHQKHSATPRVRFDVTLMQRNIHELVAIVELGARLGVEQVSLRHMVAFEGLGMEQESLSHVKALSNYWIDRAVARATALGIEVQNRPEPFDLAIEAYSRVEHADAPYIPSPYCPFPFFHVSMGAGGHLHPCPHSHGEEPFGQVSEAMPLERLWLGSKFMTLRRRILAGDPPDMCRRCPYLADKYPNVGRLFATRPAH